MDEENIIRDDFGTTATAGEWVWSGGRGQRCGQVGDVTSQHLAVSVYNHICLCAVFQQLSDMMEKWERIQSGFDEVNI